jgi:hypothetical protein
MAIVFLAASPVRVTAADTIAAIVANPTDYDGKAVDVTGTVKDVQALTESYSTTVTHWYRVELCDDDGSCLIAVRFAPVKVDRSRPVRITGTYWWSRHDDPEPFTFLHVMEIKSITQVRR